MRYIMIDRVTEFQKGEYACAIKNITMTDEMLQDHFPAYPVFPGALILEAIAQLSGFLLEVSLNRPEQIRRALLAQVQQAKFHKLAEPGDQLLIRVTINQLMEDAAKIDAKVLIAGEKAATATLTFILKELDFPKIHEQRKEFYTIWTRHLTNIPEIL